MKINFFLAASIMFVLMVIVPPIILKIFRNKPHIIKILSICLGVVYAVLLVIGTTADVSMKNNVISIKYSNSIDWFSMRFAVLNGGIAHILINLVLLFPIGFLVYIFSSKHCFLKTVLISFAVSIIIETYQFILPVDRSTELADIVFNTLSGVLSATYCEILKRFKLFEFKTIISNQNKELKN